MIWYTAVTAILKTKKKYIILTVTYLKMEIVNNNRTIYFTDIYMVVTFKVLNFQMWYI